MSNDRVVNDALKEAIRQARISYETLARDVRVVANQSGDSLRTNKSAVAHWVKGRRPNQQTATYIAAALSRRLRRDITPAELHLTDDDGPDALLGLRLGPDPVDILRRLADSDLRRRQFLTGAAYSVAAAALPLGAEQAVEYQQRATSQRAGRPEVEAVQDMVAMYTAIDERHGGQHGRAAVAQYLTSDVAALCRARYAHERDHAAMLSAAASVAYLCGWKSYDAGEHGLAQRYYLQAYQLTREAGDDLHGAWILRILAHNGMDIRRPEHTLDLADAALGRVRGRVDAATEAVFAITRARALANAGCGPEAVAQVRQAQDLALAGDAAELPYWAALWGSPRATVSSHTAKTFRALGDHGNAERHYAASARSRTDKHTRITALTLAAQGREQAAQGHLEQACGTWSRSLGLLDGVRSARAVDEVAGIRRQLRPLSGRVRAAADLDEQARVWQAGHT